MRRSPLTWAVRENAAEGVYTWQRSHMNVERPWVRMRTMGLRHRGQAWPSRP